MTDTAATLPGSQAHPLANSSSKLTTIFLIVVILAGAGWAGSQLIGDLAVVHAGSALPYLLLGLALFIALGFEFVNGFHDTANAVATVIYTHSLPANIAVVWSGMWNLAGVLVSSGAVAFTIVSLLPVELILQVGTSAGFAMVFALLIAAIMWNLGTWWLGLQFAYPDRLGHRRRPHEPDHGRPERHQRRGLGTGDQDRVFPAGLAGVRFRAGRRIALADEDLHQDPFAL
jgi:hypothetical protein